MLSHSDIFSCWVGSVAWSCLFAGVNAVKIFEILHERHVEVHMNQEQEELFVEHFMPHGITPKQFEKIENKARQCRLRKGDFLIRKGGDLAHVFLVVEGSTQAHILGRTLSGASTSRETKGDQKIGGDSGAWVGEMTFLQNFGSKANRNEEAEDSHLESRRQGLGISLYSIVAAEDCTVMSWSHSDLEELMESSTDLRAALTRAMTSALVGKIVNLTVSRKDVMVNIWSGWLADWKHNDGASVQVSSLQKGILDDDGTMPSGRLPADGEKS
jgi:CRP-like cAMP-binding protein